MRLLLDLVRVATAPLPQATDLLSFFESEDNIAASTNKFSQRYPEVSRLEIQSTGCACMLLSSCVELRPM